MKKYVILGALLALTGCEDMAFECSQDSANQAAELINKNYKNFGGVIRLKNPETVKVEKDHLYCRAKANVVFDYVSYELIRTEDGIIISTNPFADAMQAAFDEIENAFNDIDFDF